MVDVTANETVDRVVLSLKANNARFQNGPNGNRFRRYGLTVYTTCAFVLGIVIGALPVTDRAISGIAKVSMVWLGLTARN